MKLGQPGGVEARSQGEGELPAKKRKPRPAEKVAARVRAFLESDVPVVAEGVQPLAEGFFAMQRLRNTGKTKLRSESRRLRT